MKKLFLLLNLFAASHFIMHHTNSAQPDGRKPATIKQVSSLQNLCWNFVMQNSAAIPHLETNLLENTYVASEFTTKKVAAIAANMINSGQKRSEDN